MQNPEILVPTDFSDLSRRALRAADQWAELFAGQITPVYCYDAITDLDGFHFHGPGSSISGDLPAIRAEVQRALGDFARQDVAASRLREGLFVLGAPARAIARTSLDYDLVMITSHGRSGFSRFFLGSVTDKLVQLAPSPILVIHDEPVLTRMARLIVITDLSTNSAAALPVAGGLAAATGATVELLHVHEAGGPAVASTEELEGRLRAFAASHCAGVGSSFETRVVVTDGSVKDGLVRQLRESPASLIVMTTVGDDPSGERHLLGDNPTRILRHVEAPVLLVTPESGRRVKMTALTN